MLEKTNLETKAGHDIGAAFDDFMHAFESFKETNDARLDELEKRSAPDVVTVEKLDRISKALDDQGGHLLTSLVVSLGAVVICLAIAAPAAYGLARFGLRGTRTIVFGTLITQMVPGIVIANALYNTYVDLGLVNSYIGLMLADASLGIPFSIVLLRSFMVSIPGEVVEAAQVDGAGALRTFLRVVLPLATPAIAAVAILQFQGAWNGFFWPNLILQERGNWTLPLGIAQFQELYSTQWPPLMAVVVMATVPILALYVFFQRYFVEGIAAAGVKG